MTSTIVCPNCKHEITVEEAFSHQLEEEKKRIAETTKKEMGEEVKLLREKLDEARKQELDLRKMKNSLEEEKKEFDLKLQRQLDEERKKIQEKTQLEIAEQQRLKDKEKDLQIEQLKKLLDDAQRKASQGSQQLQGEVQELDLEETLRQNFLEDEIQPVGKGVLGADVRQIVKSPKGIICGTILWESKRTKTWGGDWTAKLKQDMINDKANLCAIVSEVLPEEAKSGMGIKEGVWVVSLGLVLPLAALLRKVLLDTTKQKLVTKNQENKAGLLYEYVTNHEFSHQVEAMVTTYMEMQEQIMKERVAFEKSWKVREGQVNKLLMGLANVYGRMQGVVGTALPSVPQLELE